MGSSLSQASLEKKKRIPSEVQEIFSALETKPDNFETAWYNLQALANRISTSSEQTLAPSSLSTVAQALKLFGLHEDKTGNPFSSVESLPVPLYLEQSIARIHSVTTGVSFSQADEALSRMILEQILVCCLYQESQQSDQQPPEQATHTHSSHTSSNTPGIYVDKEEPAVLEILHETPLSRDVIHEGQTKRLSAFVDYTIWYDRSEKGKATMATNLVIVNAKRQHYTTCTLPQLACYMGLVYASRKDASKENCTVYGIVSNGRDFHFCRIDNDGVLTMSNLLEWNWDKDQIYSIIRSLLRSAAILAPSKLPIKDPLRRRIALGSPQQAQSFHSKLGQLRVYDLDDLEDVELVYMFPDRQE